MFANVTSVELSVPAASTPKAVLAAPALVAPVPPRVTGTVPAVRNFAKEFNMDRKASKLYEVFQSGPMKKIAKYGGLPKPTGCV